ncbi:MULTISPECIES: SnoaL-like domain-containing protein [Croceitalea]|uniref:Nuclear transport factor 2 family protein n=1 Tax=Croceitalea vernalis TaxID=3075599 RepID=A0ABU3BDG5_9FLAO|nr:MULTISPECIES: SnoaL-like domain-containing protein [unclassified Croceitalea]MDT0538614.1 nuclear transport factor 2 family protein [Croceitalea sp. P059]MDT0620399.1 nuclear transport factor 2 family protein [Croceitalea sp. P007]
MTTKEVADKFVGLCKEGKYDEAYGMYAENAVSEEMPGIPNHVTKGRENIIKEYQQWAENIEEMHGGDVGEHMVAGNHFVVPMSMDATFKDRGRQKIDELCVYQVENDQITRATYHYQVPEMGQGM